MLKDLEATGVGMVIGITVFLLANVAIARIVDDPDGYFGRFMPYAVRDHQAIVVPARDTDPESLFANNCAICHQADGNGMPGQFPPLAGSEWVTADPETPIRVMLRGIQGEIEVGGATYNGVMPAQNLDDEQIALVATKIRTSWGNEAEEVTPEMVAAVRATLTAGAINGGEELSALRGE